MRVHGPGVPARQQQRFHQFCIGQSDTAHVQAREERDRILFAGVVPDHVDLFAQMAVHVVRNARDLAVVGLFGRLLKPALDALAGLVYMEEIDVRVALRFDGREQIGGAARPCFVSQAETRDDTLDLLQVQVEQVQRRQPLLPVDQFIVDRAGRRQAFPCFVGGCAGDSLLDDDRLQAVLDARIKVAAAVDIVQQRFDLMLSPAVSTLVGRNEKMSLQFADFLGPRVREAFF